ncbi:MAG: ATP-binding protein [bacterium]
MYVRTFYLNKIKPFINKPVIKVITGMRRVGKSYFLRQIIDLLQQQGVKEKNILYIDKEDVTFDFIQNYSILNTYIKKRLEGIDGHKYLFVDEIQEIIEWEKTIRSLFKEEDIDIYITGSNAHLFSSELVTLLAGRYIEFPIYSLSFKEFLTFRGERRRDSAHEFNDYLRFGGMPALHYFEPVEDVIYQYLKSIYDTILLKDVIRRYNIRNIYLLENICKYLFENIGNIFSAKRVSDYLKSQKIPVSVETVYNYISYFLSSYAIFKVQRFDIKGKRILEIHEKYFPGDIGIRHAILSFKENDISSLLENLIFLELKRRGYVVYIGKLDEKEIDFMAVKENRKYYIQIAYLLINEETIQREIALLTQIKDNYPKYLLSMDTLLSDDFAGIRRLNIIDFLLSDEL